MRTVIIRLPNDEHVPAVIQHVTQNYNAIAFEVHTNQNDDYVELNEVAAFYEGDFQEHEHVTALLAMGYTLTPWAGLEHETRCEFAELIDVYSQGPDYVNAALAAEESFDEFKNTHQNWLEEPKTAG